MIGVLGDDEPTLVDARRLLIHLVRQHNLRPPRVVPPAPRVPLGPTPQVQLPVGIVTAAPLQDNQSVHLSHAVLISQLDGEAHVVTLLILRHLLFFGHPWCSLLSSEHPTRPGPRSCVLLNAWTIGSRLTLTLLPRPSRAILAPLDRHTRAGKVEDSYSSSPSWVSARISFNLRWTLDLLVPS